MAEDDPLLGHGRQIIVREEWLRRTEEPILEPGLPILVAPFYNLDDLQTSTFGRAMAEDGDPDVRFILLWIGFNAAYAGHIESDGDRERDGFGQQ